MSGWTSNITSPRILASHASTRSRVRIMGAHPGWLCVIAARALSLLGASAIGLSSPSSATRQLLFLGLGVVAAGISAWPHPRLWRRAAWPTPDNIFIRFTSSPPPPGSPTMVAHRDAPADQNRENLPSPPVWDSRAVVSFKILVIFEI